MKRVLISALVAVACSSYASDVVWDVTSNPTNAALAVSGSARPFVGQLDSVHVYVPVGLTGTVSVAINTPYGGPDVIVATKAAATGYTVFVPRVTATTTAGAAGLTVTNAGHRAVMAGESITATISAVSDTNKTIRFRAVYTKE